VSISIKFEKRCIRLGWVGVLLIYFSTCRGEGSEDPQLHQGPHSGQLFAGLHFCYQQQSFILLATEFHIVSSMRGFILSAAGVDFYQQQSFILISNRASF
jgi:hypothetical protein